MRIGVGIVKRAKTHAALALLRLSYAFTWLGCACLRANERLHPLAADVPTLAPERGEVDSFTLELVAWRGSNGENEGSRTLTSRQAGVIRRAWELKGAVAS